MIKEKALALRATSTISSIGTLGMLYWMLYLKLPLNKVGYWLTTPKLALKWWIS